MSELALWPTNWVRAVLDLAILGCLMREPLHGYGLAAALQSQGFGRLRGGSLYPVLARLEDQGAITARWIEGDAGPGRKEYAITEPGREQWQAMRAAWWQLTQVVAGPVAHDGRDGGTS